MMLRDQPAGALFAYAVSSPNEQCAAARSVLEEVAR
jgi:hypothetical protein